MKGDEYGGRIIKYAMRKTKDKDITNFEYHWIMYIAFSNSIFVELYTTELYNTSCTYI